MDPGGISAGDPLVMDVNRAVLDEAVAAYEEIGPRYTNQLPIVVKAVFDSKSIVWLIELGSGPAVGGTAASNAARDVKVTKRRMPGPPRW